MDYALIISAIQGLMAATSVWQSERDHQQSLRAYEEARKAALRDPRTEKRAIALKGVLPANIAKVFLENIESCWESHKKCISGAKTYEQHEYCERLHQVCLCSNLKYMANGTGCLPEDIVSLWSTWSCGVKPRVC